MFAQFLIAFREGLEGAILTAILLGYLQKTQRPSLTRVVWYGVGAAIVASFLLSFTINMLYGGLTGPMKPLFEGVAALIAVAVLSSMIYWMAVQG
ncbi:MAG: FTR1 family protein, partial [Candidatus Ranarchaeia archaeon]